MPDAQPAAPDGVRRRVAVVTGGAQGIGASIVARLLADDCITVVLDRDADALAAQRAGAAGRYDAVPCDVRSPQEVADAFATVVRRHGAVDVLVANAGVHRPAMLRDATVEEWDEVFGVNTRGVFLTVKAAAPHMMRAGWGRIILASSFAAIIPSVGSLAYAASKAAVVSMTRVLAAELGPHGITVNSYAPGMVPTQMLGLPAMSPARQEELLDTLCIREWGRGEDIAALVAFLASDEARYITGAHIDASGGKYAVQFPKLARS